MKEEGFTMHDKAADMNKRGCFLVNKVFLYVLSVLLLVACCSLPAAVSSAETKDSASSKSQKVTFNFIDVELQTVAKFISEVTKKNFIFDERVKGKITIIAPSKLSVEDAYNLFTSVLDLKGFTVMPSGVDAYKIIPSSEAKQRGIEIAKDKHPVSESYIARLIPLKNISSDDALRFIQPVVSRDGYVSAFGPGNLLLIIDSGLNIEKILSIIQSIDQPALKEGPEMVFLKHSGADAVAKILNDGMGQKPRTPQQPLAVEEAKAVADTRLNAVVLFGDRGARESMKALIALLDVPSREAVGRINVYFLENAEAAEIAKVMEGIIKSAQPQQRQAVPGAAPVTTFEAAGGISITADKASNALIIVAAPSDYQNLIHVIKQLDRRRKQVYVEAMIVEASIDDLRELGAKWRLTGKHNGDPVAIGGFGTLDAAALTSVIYGLEGVTLGGMGNFLDIPMTTVGTDGAVTTSTLKVPGFAALFSLNEFKDAVNVLSTPQILTSDNKEAEIVVGENVPFISKRERDLTTANTVLSSIERKDVGITLRITPQITEGDYVKLDIYQEISSVKQESENIVINVGPTTTKRSTRTSVVVKDGQTVVIGGLMQEKEEDNLTKVPVLGDIPVLGWLFKHKSTSKKKTNLLVFLSPNIIKESGRLAQITKEKHREFVMGEKRYAEGELLVKFKEGVADDAARKMISEKDASVVNVIEGIRVYHIKLPKGQSVEDAVKEFSGMPEVQYAEPNYKVKIK